MHDLSLLRFLARHSLIGMMAGCVFVGVFLAFDVAGVGSLIMASDIGLTAALMLAFFTGLTFASVQVTFAVLELGSGDNGSTGTPFDWRGRLAAIASHWTGGSRAVTVPIRVRGQHRR